MPVSSSYHKCRPTYHDTRASCSRSLGVEFVRDTSQTIRYNPPLTQDSLRIRWHAPPGEGWCVANYRCVHRRYHWHCVLRFRVFASDRAPVKHAGCRGGMGRGAGVGGNGIVPAQIAYLPRRYVSMDPLRRGRRSWQSLRRHEQLVHLRLRNANIGPVSNACYNPRRSRKL